MNNLNSKNIRVTRSTSYTLLKAMEAERVDCSLRLPYDVTLLVKHQLLDTDTHTEHIHQTSSSLRIHGCIILYSGVKNKCIL